MLCLCFSPTIVALTGRPTPCVLRLSYQVLNMLAAAAVLRLEMREYNAPQAQLEKLKCAEALTFSACRQQWRFPGHPACTLRLCLRHPRGPGQHVRSAPALRRRHCLCTTAQVRHMNGDGHHYLVGQAWDVTAVRLPASVCLSVGGSLGICPVMPLAGCPPCL